MRNPAKGRPHPQLWDSCWRAIQSLRPAFSRGVTFMWFATVVVGLMVRSDLLGVTSIIRALNLRPKLYDPLRKHFHSSAIKLDQLAVLWARTVQRLFSNPVRFKGRLVLVGDGIKIPKRGKQMPGVKLLHQQSNCSTKPEYIMGHSLQAVALLVHAASSFFAVPLALRIHEGLVWSNRDKRTLLDKMLGLIETLTITDPFYFVADAYYAAGKIVKGLLKQGNHLVTRVKSNAVTYLPVEPKKGRRKRGRPKLYGKKIRVTSLLTDHKSMEEAVVNVYGEGGVKIRYCMRDLMWRPVGRLVRFVAVIHPTRGAILLMSTDLTLCALDIISIYGLRFKIEHMFRQAVRLIGSFFYHFLDDGYETVATPERKSVPSSRVGSLPRPSPPQNPCLPCLHAGWHHRPRPASVSLGRVSQAGLGVVRLLAQNHSSRHSTIGTCRRSRDARNDFRFSRELRQKQFSRKIHR